VSARESRRTQHSARHQYATWRLKYGDMDEQVTADALAPNMGTSAACILQHCSHKTVEVVESKLVGRRRT
jgi:hypothetical protein